MTPQSLESIEVRAVGDHRSGEMKSEVSHSNSSIASRDDVLVHCTAETRTCHHSDAFDSRKYCSKYVNDKKN